MTDFGPTDEALIGRLLPHVAMRVLNTPLMVTPDKLDVILSVVGSRIGLETSAINPLGPTGVAGLQTAERSTFEITPNGIAVIDVSGSLAHKTNGLDAMSGMTSYLDIGDHIAIAAADRKVRGIMLMVDSPGGETAGAFDLADEIFHARSAKPVAAFISETGASAAYLLASAAQQIFVTQSAVVGSIGVVAKHVDRTGANAARGLKVTLITAGEGKAIGHPDQPLGTAGMATLQHQVNSFYGLFVEKVASYRNLTSDDIRKIGANVFRGPEAVDRGLADAVGTYHQALAWFETKSSAPSVAQHGKNRVDLNSSQPASNTNAKAFDPVAVMAEAELKLAAMGDDEYKTVLSDVWSGSSRLRAEFGKHERFEAYSIAERRRAARARR